MNQILNLIILTSILIGCNNTSIKEEVVKVEEVDLTKEIINDSVEEESEKGEIYLDSTEIKLVDKLDSIYSKTPYFTKVNNNILFYVCKGEWKERTYEDNKIYPKGDNLKFGLVNKQLEVILPLEYDKICNPDITANGYIEIEKDGKLGLFNYKTNKIINCEFDVIFPSNNNAIAIGKVNNNYYNIFEKKKELILDSNQIPKYSKLLQNHNFDALDSSITYIRNSYFELFEDNPIEGTGVLVTPSYLNRLQFLPEIQSEIVYKGKEEFGIVESKNIINESRTFGDKITAFISSFYEEGVDGRGYQLNQKRIFTVNKNEKLVVNRLMTEFYDYNEFYFCKEGKPSLKFINDTLVELRELVRKPNDYIYYRSMPIYSYYSLNRIGEMRELKSNRFFNFTKYVKLNSTYFEDCYTQYTETNKEEGYGEIYLLEHLSINDLDIMRNEIFAEYGYKFKSEKWNNYFKNKEWYSPKYDNVDDMLTEIDKHNIDLILKTKELLKKSEEKIINKTKINFGMAG